MTQPTALKNSLDSQGWAVTEPVVPAAVLEDLLAHLASVLAESPGRGGIRNLLDTSEAVRAVAATGPVREAATSVLGADSGAVRAILFDKTPDANWRVIWHQDLTIAVTAERPTDGYGPWSVKEGVVHVQPPVAVLERMLAVRLHLDPCTPWNGPVRVLPGSHRTGKLAPTAIDAVRARVPEVMCVADAGALLLFHPLLLHASSPAERPEHRRVLHIEYGPPILPGGLRWHAWVPATVPRAT